MVIDLGSVKMSAQTNEIFSAISKAQAEIESVGKEKQVNMSRDGKPGAKYKYAELSDVQAALKDPYAKHGLSYSQWLTSSGINTMISHSSGQWIMGTLSDVEIQMRGHGPQDYGSLTTYLRRYHLAAATGVAQEDDDAISAQQSKPQEKPKIEKKVFNHAPGAANPPPQPPSFPDDLDQIPEDNMQNFKTKEPSKSHQVITDQQVKRLFAISKNNNYSQQDLRMIVKESCGVDSTSQIPWVRYEQICQGLQAQLPADKIIESVLIKHGSPS